jgi:microcystin-dependent protein
MPYTIPFSDPSKSSSPITVNDLTENTTSTSLALVGRNYSNYGVAFAKNFVHLLEHFASPSAPNNSVEGQIWYNNTTKRLYVNDSTGGTGNWRPAGGTHVAPTTSTPQNPLLGDLWVDTLTQQLRLYNGSDWVLVGPTALSGKKTGSYVESLEDSYGVKHLVTIEYANDSAIKVTATESFLPQKIIDGFLTINPGVNISSKKFIGPADTTTANTVAKIYGVATIAESLNVTSPSTATVSANNFARRDTSNQYYGQQSILNDAGLNIGSVSNFSLSVLQGTAVVKNTSDGGSIDFVISNQGSQNIIVKLDGRNKRVGINHPTPQVELDVNGSAYVSGQLLTTGTTDSTSTTTGSVQFRGGLGVAKNLNVGKSIKTKGTITVGTIDDSGNLVADTTLTASILPQQADNASPIYNIGTPTRRFKTVYADTFSGSFSGNFSGTVQGQVLGSAQRLTSFTNFILEGEVITTAPASFDGAGGDLKINTVLSDDLYKNRTEVVDSRVDDTLLVYRANTGIRRVTRTNFLLGEAFVPIGSIFPFAGTVIPLGYLLCDGALVSRVEYPFLYQAIGSVYGASAGGEYFRLPDMRGRFPLGNANMANPLANLLVNKTVTLPNLSSSTTVKLSNTENIYIGMIVTGSSSIPTNTVVVDLSVDTVTLNNSVIITSGTTLTFTIRVLKDPIPVNSIDRVGAVTGNNSASEVGGTGGFSKLTLNTQTAGSAPIYTGAGSSQNFNTTFDVGLTNPYLTINYIIRVGVGASQLG